MTYTVIIMGLSDELEAPMLVAVFFGATVAVGEKHGGCPKIRFDCFSKL